MRFCVITLLLLLMGAPALAYQISPQQNLDLLWTQVHDHPNDFAVACIPLNDRARTVLYNPNERFPLASVSKLLIFIEYARRVDGGGISRDEQVDVAELNRYALARTDRGAHDDFMDTYGAGVQQIPLWDVAAIGMMRYSSNAASDYMLARLDPVDWNALYTQLYMSSTDPPHPLSMIPLLMNNHETGKTTWDTLETLSAAQGNLFYYAYLNNPDWRAQEIAYRTAQRRTFPAWNIQTIILQEHTATGTVYDLINVLGAVYSNSTILTDGTKSMVRQALRWTNNDAINATYVEYGSKLGSYSGGTLTLVSYGDPYEGSPVISATLFRGISQQRFYDMLRADSIGDFAHWMNLNTCRGLQERIISDA